jgi:hypothetical protein
MSSTRGGRPGQDRFPPRPLLTLQCLHRRTLRVLQHLDASGVLASTRSRREWNDVGARAAAQRDAPASGTTMTPAGESEAPGPRFPTGCAMPLQPTLRPPAPTWRRMRTSLATTCWRSKTSSPPPTTSRITAPLASCPPPPATSHGYAEWDFSGVPDPVMFQQFLDAADYWFDYSETSSAGSYDPARECFMVAIGDVVDGTSAAGAGDGDNPRDPGTSMPRNSGPSTPPPRWWEAPTSTRN